jgi:hypothetical protein
MGRSLIAVALVLASFPADAKKCHPFTALNCTATMESSFALQNGTWSRNESADPVFFVIDSISYGAGTAILRGTPDSTLTISHASGPLMFSTPSEDEWPTTITVFTGYETPAKALPFFEHKSAPGLGSTLQSLQIVFAGLCLPVYDDSATRPALSPTVEPSPNAADPASPIPPNVSAQRQQPAVAPATAPPDDGQQCLTLMGGLLAVTNPHLKQAILKKLRNRGCLR